MDTEILNRLKKGEEQLWLNDHLESYQSAKEHFSLQEEDTVEAEERLQRFATVISQLFPETARSQGIIESRLARIPCMQADLFRNRNVRVPGMLYLKMDSHLPVSGSVKARGGIYEVLKHAEDLAVEKGLLKSREDDHSVLCSEEGKRLFSRYAIEVGSTGNLGMSIGIMGAALGFRAVVHMSADAKQWKKDLLRKRGAEVIEYEGNYEEAVKQGRERSQADPFSYFVDDEKSETLFLGYSTAGKRLKQQLDKEGIVIDDTHPLFVYLPCGVGGAPGGIGFGLKQVFGDHVHLFFAEPTQAPCMLLGLSQNWADTRSVQDIGLSGMTEADGLAVGRCSRLAAEYMDVLLSGEATAADEELFRYQKTLYDMEDIYIEPSAAAAFKPLELLCREEHGKAYLMDVHAENAVHVIWATGGSMTPAEEKKRLLGKE